MTPEDKSRLWQALAASLDEGDSSPARKQNLLTLLALMLDVAEHVGEEEISGGICLGIVDRRWIRLSVSPSLEPKIVSDSLRSVLQGAEPKGNRETRRKAEKRH